MQLKPLMTEYQQRVEQCMAHFLPAPHIQPQRLHEAMRYTVLGGGKRVRPLLVYLTGKALDIQADYLDAPACAVELIHAYSLVHDDLPCMDDDDLRRGKPTCHVVYGEAMATLVGDGLQTLAFQVLAKHNHANIPAEQRLRMLDILSMASGSRGMVGGQVIDMEAVGQSLNLTELENMHIHKTGALICASVKLGALACETALDNSIFEKLGHYAKCIGLAFQVQDDILDIEADTDTLGKPQGADQALNKPTYPSLLGLSGAKQMAGDLLEQALSSLDGLGSQADPLRWLASYIVTRGY